MTVTKKAPEGAEVEDTKKLVQILDDAKLMKISEFTKQSDIKIIDGFACAEGLQRVFTVSEEDIVIGKDWKAKAYTWDTFTQMFRTPTLAPCTLAQYKKIPKEVLGKKGNNDPKDGRCYFGGTLSGSRKMNDNVTARTLVTIDIDEDTHRDMWEDIAQRLQGLAAIIHTSFKSTKEAPRYRVIIPTTRDMTLDEWVAVTRWTGRLCGINCDTCSEKKDQAMYYPRVPSDMCGEYEVHYLQGGALDVDKVLPEAKLLTPEDKKRSSKRDDGGEGTPPLKQDSLTIPGPVGDFCKAYTIEEAIETFLSGTYKPTGTRGRYTHTKSESPGGLVCYQHKFATSHHTNTDPAAKETCHNAFDLVRVTWFEPKDKDTPEDTPIEKRPSHLAMCKWVQTDPRVVKRITAMKNKEAAADFPDMGGDWETSLTRDKNNNVTPTPTNLKAICANDKQLQGIRYDLFKEKYVIKEGSPFRPLTTQYLNDTSLADISRHLETVYGIKIRVASLGEKVLTIIQRQRNFHPVKDYISQAKWDGVPRVERLLIDYLGAADTPLTRAMTRKWMVAAVARIYNPGVKFDYVLTLAGPQDIGKSSIFKILSGPKDWFNDTFSFTADGKTQREALVGAWIIEMGELKGLRKAEVEATKAFISATEDTYRAAYGRTTETHPRQCVFAATTNEEYFLRSITGDRRWWVVDVPGGEDPRDVWGPRLEADTPQIWAEALHIYRQGERLFLTKDLEAAAREAQQRHNVLEGTGIIGELAAWLDIPLHAHWNVMSPHERARYFQYRDEFARIGKRRRTVCVAEVKKEFDNTEVKGMSAQQIGRLLDLLPGWRRVPTPRYTGAAYGKQRVWERVEEDEDDL